MSVGVAIVGFGGMGQKRAQHLAGATLIAASDHDVVKSLRSPALLHTRKWQDAVTHPFVDLVIVATSHNALATVAVAALEAGKHVFLEKPGAINLAELSQIETAAQRSGKLVRLGFNHRYHPAIRKAYDLAQAGVIGPLTHLRGRYGHGGRPGYDREWRADPALSGGGELIDQGIHLIDLAQWFLGPLTVAHAELATYYWEMPVEDNAFLTLKSATGHLAFLHASCTEWKNLFFSLEIFGSKGKLQIDGLGGSYGVERLTRYTMKPEMGPPKTVIDEYPGPDESWTTEFRQFLIDIELGHQPEVGLPEARAALQIVESVYHRAVLA